MESVCEDSASLSITTTDLASAIRECDDLADIVNNIGVAQDSTECYDSDNKAISDMKQTYMETAMVKECLLILEDKLIATFAKYSTDTGESLAPKMLFELFSTAGLVPNDPNDILKLDGVISKIKSALSEKNSSTKGS